MLCKGISWFAGSTSLPWLVIDSEVESLHQLLTIYVKFADFSLAFRVNVQRRVEVLRVALIFWGLLGSLLVWSVGLSPVTRAIANVKLPDLLSYTRVWETKYEKVENFLRVHECSNVWVCLCVFLSVSPLFYKFIITLIEFMWRYLSVTCYILSKCIRWFQGATSLHW